MNMFSALPYPRFMVMTRQDIETNDDDVEYNKLNNLNSIHTNSKLNSQK